MEGNNELKEIDIKNRTCFYFDEIIKVGNFDFDNILLNKKFYKKLYERILIYNISYKFFWGAKTIAY